MNELEVYIDNQGERKCVGVLRERDTRSLPEFSYSDEFIKTGFSISPIELPLKAGSFQATTDMPQGMFGVFMDSLPDGWGTMMLSRYLRQSGINYQQLSPIEQLAYIGSSGRGALEYVPSKNLGKRLVNIDCKIIHNIVNKVLSDTDLTQKEANLLVIGSASTGGARPKVFAEFDNAEWLVKFPAKNDPYNIGESEYVHTTIAEKCGITTSEVRLLNNELFASKRFDRDSRGKVHTVSMAGLLSADFRQPIYDYNDLFEITGALTHSQNELDELFRRMVYNVTIRNTDDHLKNFSMQYKDGCWQHSPMYDIAPMESQINGHFTSINGKINPGMDDLLSLGDLHTVANAKDLVNQIRDTYNLHKNQDDNLSITR